MKCLNIPCCSPYKGNFDEIANYFLERNIPFKIISGKTSAWRTRSKLAVRGTAKNPIIGLFKEGTHEPYNLLCCSAHHPKINAAISKIRQWIIDCQIPPYSEHQHQGLLRYLQLVVERKTDKVQATFVLNSVSDSLDFSKLVQDDIWHSLWINYNPSHLNTIFGPTWSCRHGNEWLEDQIAGVPLYYLPGSFAQANPYAFEKLIDAMDAEVPSGQRIGELYAGVGIIGTALAKKAAHVILTEVNPESKKCFDKMYPHLDASLQNKLEYRLQSAKDSLDLLNEVDVLIVDPPRKGLDPLLLKALQEPTKAHTLVYVSCGWPSLVRDLNVLTESGWKVTKSEGHPFFPGTPHLETLTFLSRY